MQIIAPVGRLHGIKTPAVQGSMDIGAGLDKLLVGTGLEVLSADGNTIVLRQSSGNEGALGVQIAQSLAPRLRAMLSRHLRSIVESVVVTGSRVITNGNNSPTPLTVVTTANLEQVTPSNIPDGLNRAAGFHWVEQPEYLRRWRAQLVR